MKLFDSIFKPNIEKLKKEKDLPNLTKALEHKDAQIRQSAARALMDLGDIKSLETFIHLLVDADPAMRDIALQALEKYSQTDPKMLAKYVMNDDPQVWKTVMALLEKLGTEKCNQSLAYNAFDWPNRDPQQVQYFFQLLVGRVGEAEAHKLAKQERLDGLTYIIKYCVMMSTVDLQSCSYSEVDREFTLEYLGPSEWTKAVVLINYELDQGDPEACLAVLKGLVEGMQKVDVALMGVVPGLRQFMGDLAVRDIPRLGMTAGELLKLCGW